MSYLPKLITPYKEIERLLISDLEQGIKAVNQHLNSDPNNENSRLLLARAQRLKHQYSLAQTTLEQLILHAPRYILAHVELSELFSQQKLYQQASIILKEALGIAPEYHEIWSLLAQSYFDQGNKSDAKNALAQFDMIKAFNDSLSHAYAEFELKNYVTAERECRRLLDKVPNEVRVLRLLAKISAQFGHAEVAASILKYCQSVKSDDLEIAIEYAQSLINAKQGIDASPLCIELLKKWPKNIKLLSVLAEAQVKMGNYEGALNTYKKVQIWYPDNALSTLRYGNVHKILGHADNAIASYKQSISINPLLGEAYWNLSNLKTYTFTLDDIAGMEEVLKNPLLKPFDHMLICFSLGKAYEDSANFSQSFHYYQRANCVNAQQKQPKNDKHLNRVMSFFNEQYLNSAGSSGHSSDEPIFIVGLPRSGSTLVEQILSSHSMVDGTMELTEMVTIARSLNSPNANGEGQYPESLAQLTSASIIKLGERYLRNTASLRGQARYFIDKLPNNFNHIGLIKTIFPKAKIIDVRRHPMATGWSLYKHYFAQGHQFSYDLTSIGKYYNDYIKLMTHWQSVLPDQILTVNYEELIVDFEPVVRKILDYCEVDFEPSCLSFYNNKRPVATASSEQVRQPIYSNALDHWKNFEDFLTPLANALKQ